MRKEQRNKTGKAIVLDLQRSFVCSEPGGNTPKLCRFALPKSMLRPERASKAFLRPHRLLMLLCIASIGVGVAVTVVHFVSVSETADANRAFALEFSDRVDLFLTFFRTRLLCLRATADAVSELDDWASSEVVSKVRKLSFSCESTWLHCSRLFSIVFSWCLRLLSGFAIVHHNCFICFWWSLCSGAREEHARSPKSLDGLNE
jgi:hypothetical protein